MSKRICLIDGSGYIFRAFYALPPMSSPEGVPVNAVYGFTNMFLKLTDKIGCDYELVLFDAKRKNFRNEIYTEYKANRKEPPAELVPQFEIIREAVDALNINRLEMEGFEADDLIATIAELALKEGFDVTIVSADKDLLQLIKPGVEFYDPMKDKFFTKEDVKEKFGVYPERVIDVQALAGDASDNVPGVMGIGIKTAAELINQFGSLENLLARTDEVKQNKRREMLQNSVEAAQISKKLVTLKKDVPLKINLTDYQCHSPNLEILQNFVNKYDFKSLKNRVSAWVENHQQNCTANAVFKTVQKAYELVQTEEALLRWVEDIKNQKTFAFDTETTGLNPFFDDIVGLSLSTEEGKACYIPLRHKSKGDNFDLFGEQNAEIKQLSFELVKKHLKPLFESKSILKIGHNIKFDMHFLEQVFGKTDFFPIEDTAVLSYILDSSEHGHGLDELAELFLQYQMIPFEEVIKDGKNKISFAEVGLDKALEYAAEDADITLRLYDVFKPRLVAEHQVAVYENFDRPLISVLKDMEDEGIKVNVKALTGLSAYFEENIKGLEKIIFNLAGTEFNLGSPKQIGEILFGKMGLKGKKSPAGGWQTGADVLQDLADDGCEICKYILSWREFAKLKSTYTDSLLNLLDKNNRVHTTFNQITANTGRLASSNPNLQNIPIRSEEGAKIRACFIAKENHKLISCDYSQVELRLLANVADVKALKQAFKDGLDLHRDTASRVFGVPYDEVSKSLRSHAKAINFGIVYGISEFGLARQLGISKDEAKKYIESYFKQMPEIRQYMEETIKFAHKHGFVETPFGRKIAVYGINSQNKRNVANAERAAINAPIQGGAADIIKMAMNKIKKLLTEQNLQTKMILQVHDELVFEAPDSEVEIAVKIIKENMENIVDFDVPLIAEAGIGQNWADAH